MICAVAVLSLGLGYGQYSFTVVMFQKYPVFLPLSSLKLTEAMLGQLFALKIASYPEAMNSWILSSVV